MEYFINIPLVLDIRIDFYELDSIENFSQFPSSEVKADPPYKPDGVMVFGKAKGKKEARIQVHEKASSFGNAKAQSATPYIGDDGGFSGSNAPRFSSLLSINPHGKLDLIAADETEPVETPDFSGRHGLGPLQLQ